MKNELFLKSHFHKNCQFKWGSHKSSWYILNHNSWKLFKKKKTPVL